MFWTLLPLSQAAAFLDVLVLRRKRNKEKILNLSSPPSPSGKKTTSNGNNNSLETPPQTQQIIVLSKGYSTTKRLLRRCLQYGIVSGIGFAGVLTFATIAINSIDREFLKILPHSVASLVAGILDHVPKISDEIANILLYWPFPTANPTANNSFKNFSVIDSSANCGLLSTSPKMLYGFSSLAIVRASQK